MIDSVTGAAQAYDPRETGTAAYNHGKERPSEARPPVPRQSVLGLSDEGEDVRSMTFAVIFSIFCRC